MRIEYLFGVTYKVTLENGGWQRPSELRETLRRVSEQIGRECGACLLPEDLSAEKLTADDGTRVLLIRQKQQSRRDTFFACDLDGNAQAGALCRALTAANELSEDISFFLGEGESWRVILHEPTPTAELICRDFGDWCEISELFAALTSERLTEAARGREIALLGAALH